MIGGFAEWAGIPNWVFGSPAYVSTLRYLLAVTAFVWVRAVVMRRARSAAAAAGVFAMLATGGWFAMLQRPWGLFVEPTVTREAARCAVADRLGSPEAVLGADEPGLCAPVWAGSLAGAFGPALSVLVVSALAAGRSGLGGGAWFVAGTMALDGARAPLLDLAIRPAAYAFWLGVVALFLGASRRRRPPATPVAVAGLAAGLLGPVALGDGGVPVGVTFAGAVPWAIATVIGAAFGRPPGAASLGLLCMGAGGLVTASLGGLDPWWGSASLRLGLALAVCDAAAAGLRFAARQLPTRRRAVRHLLLWSALMGTGGAWWRPDQTDAAFHGSRGSVAGRLADAMRWIDENTAPDAVVAAAPETAPWAAVLGRRRVLRMPTLQLTDDDAQRRRKLEAVLRGGRASPRIEAAFPVAYLVAAPGDFADEGVRHPEELEGRPRLSTAYATAGGIRVLRVDAPTPR